MSNATADTLEGSIIASLPGIPAVESLTSEAFAALPKKQISSLWSAADGRSGHALRVRLAPLSYCAHYLLCIGAIGVADRRLRGVTSPRATRALGEAIFAYQIDWRYPKPFGTSMAALDAEPQREVALRRAYAHAFFSLIERTKSYFASSGAQIAAAYMIATTRSLLDTSQRATFDRWLDAVIDRLEPLAPNPTPEASASIYDYPSREAWQAAVDVQHGRPLPLELLDVSKPAPRLEAWSALVKASFEPLSPEQNPLLHARDALLAAGVAAPYRLG